MGFYAMSPDSRLFIAENIKPKDSRSSTSDMDILMMPVSGCERTKTEFESLLHGSGLRLDLVIRKPQGDWAVMIASLAERTRWMSDGSPMIQAPLNDREIP